jgi:hypothetical protein
MPKNYRDALAKLNIDTDDPPPRKQRKPKRSQSAAAPPAPKSKPASKSKRKRKPRVGVDTAKEVTCFLCGKTVKVGEVSSVFEGDGTYVGFACKRHPGV